MIPKLNLLQTDRLSEFLGNFSLLIIASVLIPAFSNKTFNSAQIIMGTTGAISSFVLSLYLLRGGENK